MKACILILLVGAAVAREAPTPASLKIAVFGRFCFEMLAISITLFLLVK
jgi:hypothetical protein